MKKLVVIALAIGALSSCKKNDEAAQLEVTAANIAGVYKLTADIDVKGGVTYDRFNGGTNGGVAYPSDYETCEKDDTYTFTATGNVTSAEGATSCTPPTSPLSFSYTVNTAAKTIIILGQAATVKSLTSTTMVVESSSTSGSVVTVNTLTYSK